MKEEKEALSVRKMNSESKVCRCAQGAESGALAWGVRLAPLNVGERDTTFHLWGIPVLWGRRVPGGTGYPRRAVATSNTGESSSLRLPPHARVVPSGHVVCSRQGASLPRTPPSVVTRLQTRRLLSKSHTTNVTLSPGGQWWGTPASIL